MNFDMSTVLKVNRSEKAQALPHVPVKIHESSMTARLVLPFLLLCTAALLVAGCGSKAPAPPLMIQPVDNPAGTGSGRPGLFAAEDGRTYLTWTEPAEDSLHALRFATWDAGGWSAPRTVAEGAGWFVNWADVPALVAGGDTLTAHYLVRGGVSPYAYDVRVTWSLDGGRTWQEAVTPHRDGTETEHGFVSMRPWSEGRTALVWLDGRAMAGGHGNPDGAMTLRFAALGPDGRLAGEALLDERTCDCCQTAAARTSGGLVVAYRDRSEGEIRDIATVRLEDGAWTSPRRLHEDGWQIAGCPVNGPALDAEGQRVAVAWFTGADDAPRVQVAFSDDAGRAFGAPIVVSEGAPLGRVDVALLEGGAALVSWLERAEEGADVRARTVHPDGTLGPAVTVAETSPARASGFPRLVRSADRIFFAWTEAGEPSRLRTAIASVR